MDMGRGSQILSYSEPAPPYPKDEELFPIQRDNQYSFPPQNNRLQTPIAIPQIQAGMGQSFLRAWAPALHNHHMTKEEFVAFVDNLNVVATASPPLQVVGLAGGMLGLVPYHWAALAGQAIQVTAKLGTHAVSKGRTEAYIRDANENMFKPRGLKVTIASTEAVTALLRVPTSTPILAPLSPQTMNMSTAERVLVAIQSSNSILDLNVPPPTAQTTTLARISAKQVAAQSKKQQEKLVKYREKRMEKEQEKAEKEFERQEKKANERQKKEEKRAKKRSQGKESDSDSDTEEESKQESHNEKDKKKMDKEAKQAQKLLWLVVENL